MRCTVGWSRFCRQQTAWWTSCQAGVGAALVEVSHATQQGVQRVCSRGRLPTLPARCQTDVPPDSSCTSRPPAAAPWLQCCWTPGPLTRRCPGRGRQRCVPAVCCCRCHCFVFESNCNTGGLMCHGGCPSGAVHSQAMPSTLPCREVPLELPPPCPAHSPAPHRPAPVAPQVPPSPSSATVAAAAKEKQEASLAHVGGSLIDPRRIMLQDKLAFVFGGSLGSPCSALCSVRCSPCAWVWAAQHARWCTARWCECLH